MLCRLEGLHGQSPIATSIKDVVPVKRAATEAIVGLRAVPKTMRSTGVTEVAGGSREMLSRSSGCGVMYTSSDNDGGEREMMGGAREATRSTSVTQTQMPITNQQNQHQITMWRYMGAIAPLLGERPGKAGGLLNTPPWTYNRTEISCCSPCSSTARHYNSNRRNCVVIEKSFLLP